METQNSQNDRDNNRSTCDSSRITCYILLPVEQKGGKNV